MSKSPVLSKIPFFADISTEQLAEIEAFSTVQEYDKGAVVFRSHEPARNLYALLSGYISLSILFREEIVTRDIKYEEYIHTNVEILEKPVIIEKVVPTTIFGWSALVEPQRMTATATCEDACKIVLIPALELKKVFTKDAELGYLISSRLSSVIAGRLDSRTQKLVDAWCSLFESEKISAV